MKKRTILIVAILLIAFVGKEAKAQSEKFNIEGSIELTHSEDEAFSINDFIESNKNDPYFSHFSNKVSDETFGEEIKKGDTVTMYLISSEEPFTEAQAHEFAKKEGGKMPSLGWALIATKEHKKEIWTRNTVIFTDRFIKHKRGYEMIPFINQENGVYLCFRESAHENCDFIFIKK